tara:strand:+ start:2845 stop:3204 length:360 start_codon:yes stop_codon:yes gene_type:complete
VTNRYNELSKGNQAIIDAFINSVASGGRDITDIDETGHRKELSDIHIKNLTIQELERIIDIRANDFSVYIGNTGKVLLTSDVSHASLNGLLVQINLETAQLENVMEDRGFQIAFGGEST